MGISQDPAPGSRRGGRSGSRTRTLLGGYLVLFLLGILQGAIGSFQYGQSPTPLIAIILIVVIFATCLACGWGIGTFADLDGRAVTERLAARGVLAKETHGSTIRLAPPLVITEDELSWGLDRFSEAVLTG